MANCSSCGRKLSGFSFGKRLCPWCVQHEAAQRGELSEDAPQPVMPTPWQSAGRTTSLTHVLVGVNILIYLAMGVVGGSLLSSPSSQQLIRSGGNFGPLTFGGEWWRLLSYNFLHGGFLHIAFNMWCLWDLGELCESLYGTWTFGALYMISGVAGGLMSVGFHPERLSVGASGAIFGLAGALIAGFYLGEFSLPRPVVQAHLRSVVAFVAFNIIFGAIASGTDNLCHLGGLLAGVGCGALIAKFAPSERNVAARFSILFLVALLLAAITVHLEHARNYMSHLQRGAEFLNQEQYAEAIEELQKAARAQPKYVPAHLNLAAAYYGNKQYPQAQAELTQALALEPDNQNALFSLGFVDLAQGSVPQAKEIFSKLIARDYSAPGGHYGLGMALAAEGNDKAAIDELKVTAQMRPNYEGVYYRLGRSQAKLKLYAEAINSFERELKNGDDYDTELELSDAYRANGQPEKAAAAKSKAEQLKKSGGQ